MNMAGFMKLHEITPTEIRKYKGCPDGDDATVRAWFRGVFETSYPAGPTWGSNPDMMLINGNLGVYKGMYA